MRSCCLAWAVLIAGGVSVISAQSQDIQVGGYFTLNSLTFTASVAKCYVVSPNQDTIELIPTNQADERFELQEPGDLFGCSVKVHDATASDTGTWAIHSETESGNQFTDSSYVSVIGGDELQISEDDLNDENIKWLTDIDYLATFGSNISIALSKIETHEDCFVRSNQGRRLDFSTDVAGVRTYGSSNYVSCRVEVGPFDGTMIGTWILCGQSMDGAQEKVRCQRANIAWHHNSPNSLPSVTIDSEIDYAVNYGLTLVPGVRGSGTLYSCHVITPAGEDIALTFESTYPKLARVRQNTASACSVSIGPIDESMIGDWSLYAIFTSSYRTNTEIHQPLHFYLYDESDPEAQAYNVTTLDVLNKVINLGATKMIEVTGSGQIDNCLIKSPAGQTYDLASSVGVHAISLESDDSSTSCQVHIGPITEDMLGDWELAGKFSNNFIFTERKQPFHITQEDPSNPVEDDIERRIEILSEESVNMNVGATHKFVIPGAGTFTTYDSCHLVTPEGLQYRLMEGFSVPGVEIVKDEDVACGVNITVVGDASVGNWVLISRETVVGTPTEKRLPITIAVEVQVDSSANEVTIAEGNNFHISLQNPTELNETCVLLRPDGNLDFEHERHVSSEYCEFVVRDMKAEDSGTWHIEYGKGVMYRASTEVKVIGRSDIEVTPLTWNLDQSLNISLGPEEAVYCRLVSPNGAVVFDDFGRCSVIITRVTDEHEGVWRMSVGLPGRILTEEMDFTVHVVHAASKAIVTVEVLTDSVSSTVALHCTLNIAEEVTGCKFKDPSDKVLLASHGVGEDRYSFHSAGSTVRSSASSHECRLSIKDISDEEKGMWRCAMDTATDTFYGFLAVIDTMDPEVTSAVTEPTLTADEEVSAVAGDQVIMSCSVAAAIRYCYFRARNGTVFNVAPGSVGDIQYAGAGFDAGECAVQFSSLQARDSGAWSCHVGLPDSSEELRVSFQVDIEDVMTASQTVDGNVLVIESRVHGDRPLDYCRFVRIDGVGFTSEHVIQPYGDTSSLGSGRCGLQVPNPTILDLHPWTVVAKVVGHDVEYSAVTESTFPMGEDPEEEQFKIRSSFYMLPMLLLCVSLSIIFMGMLLGPEKNRRWTYTRFANVRNSIRRSVTKAPLPAYPGYEKTTPFPA